MLDKPRSHIRAVIPGACVPCPRARVSRHGTYYPKRYQEWHEMAQGELLSQCGRLLWDDRVSVTVRFHGTRPNADLDNLLKSVFDALSGVVLEDDLQVDSVLASRYKKPGWEKCTVIEVLKLPEN